MFDYDETSKKAAETLDQYDLSPVLRRCYGVDIYDIEDWIKAYGDEVCEAVENLADYELADYLHQRYGMGIQEVSRYCAWWNDRKYSLTKETMNDLELSSAKRPISSKKSDYVPADQEFPSRFQRKKTYTGETAPAANENFKSMPEKF